MKNTYEGFYFFILSKGLNAGKPLEKPCPNCFVFFAKDETEKNFLYWLCFGLWQANHFHPFLTGSVIPFIRLGDLCEVIGLALSKVELRPQEFEQSVELLNQLQQHQERFIKQCQLLKQAKKALMYKVLNEIKKGTPGWPGFLRLRALSPHLSCHPFHEEGNRKADHRTDTRQGGSFHYIL